MAKSLNPDIQKRVEKFNEETRNMNLMPPLAKFKDKVKKESLKTANKENISKLLSEPLPVSSISPKPKISSVIYELDDNKITDTIASYEIFLNNLELGNNEKNLKSEYEQIKNSKSNFKPNIYLLKLKNIADKIPEPIETATTNLQQIQKNLFEDETEEENNEFVEQYDLSLLNNNLQQEIVKKNARRKFLIDDLKFFLKDEFDEVYKNIYYSNDEIEQIKSRLEIINSKYDPDNYIGIQADIKELEDLTSKAKMEIDEIKAQFDLEYNLKQKEQYRKTEEDIVEMFNNVVSLKVQKYFYLEGSISKSVESIVEYHNSIRQLKKTEELILNYIKLENKNSESRIRHLKKNINEIKEILNKRKACINNCVNINSYEFFLLQCYTLNPQMAYFLEFYIKNKTLQIMFPYTFIFSLKQMVSLPLSPVLSMEIFQTDNSNNLELQPVNKLIEVLERLQKMAFGNEKTLLAMRNVARLIDEPRVLSNVNNMESIFPTPIAGSIGIADNLQMIPAHDSNEVANIGEARVEEKSSGGMYRLILLLIIIILQIFAFT